MSIKINVKWDNPGKYLAGDIPKKQMCQNILTAIIGSIVFLFRKHGDTSLRI